VAVIELAVKGGTGRNREKLRVGREEVEVERN
jgi:hypothetical protein